MPPKRDEEEVRTGDEGFDELDERRLRLEPMAAGVGPRLERDSRGFGPAVEGSGFEPDVAHEADRVGVS